MNSSLAKFSLMVLLGWPVASHAVTPGQTWNAYSDFYLSPNNTTNGPVPVSGWNGATSPSALGAAWGYYLANVNGFGFPTQSGSYSTLNGSGSGSQNLFRYSNYSPLGNTGSSFSQSLWDPTGGAGFPRYADNMGWGSSLGRFDTSTTWWPGAPGYSKALNNMIWMQSGWLEGAGSEGIGTVLTWTAPETSAYTIAGQFIAGNQPGNSAAIAIVDSIGTALLSRQGLSNDATQSFSFTVNYNAGDVIQFHVGNQFSTGNAVGLQVSATAIPEPSSGLLLVSGLGFLGLMIRRRC